MHWVEDPEKVDWNPLFEAVPRKDAGSFMHMEEDEAPDGTVVQVYKHRTTRDSLILSLDGRAWARFNGTYTPIDRDAAIYLVLRNAKEWDKPWDAKETVSGPHNNVIPFPLDPR